jgi:hypothetical protein
MLPIGARYVRKHSLRLPVAHMDRACTDGRFPPSSFLELIFAPINVSGDNGTPGAKVASASMKPLTTPMHVEHAVPADGSDAALEPQSRFWDDVDRRKVLLQMEASSP